MVNDLFTFQKTKPIMAYNKNYTPNNSYIRCISLSCNHHPCIHSNTQQDLKQLIIGVPWMERVKLGNTFHQDLALTQKGLSNNSRNHSVRWRLLVFESTPFTTKKEKKQENGKEKACKWGWKPQKAFSRKAIRFLVRKGGWLR